MLAKEHKLNFRTVSRYINITDVEESSIYDTSNQRSSYLDKYKSQILALYNKTRNISEVYRRLEDYIPNLKYSTLKYYIRKLEKNGYKNDRIKDDMPTLFWTYFNRTIYLIVYEFISNYKIVFLALSRAK